MGFDGRVAATARRIGHHPRLRVRPVRHAPQRDRPRFIATKTTDATAARIEMNIDEFHRIGPEVNGIRQVGLLEDIAVAVTFLSADESLYIIGQTTYVDGSIALSA